MARVTIVEARGRAYVAAARTPGAGKRRVAQLETMATPDPTIPPAAGSADPDARREETLRRFEARVDPLMAVLGVVFLAVVILEISNIPLTAGETRVIRATGSVIYGLFIVDFLVRLAISPRRWAFIKDNWLLAVSLALPFLAPLRILRIAPAASAITASRAVAGIGRALDELSLMLRGKAFVYLVMITILVVLLGAGVVLQLDRSHANTPFANYGDALWWAATVITTMNNSDDPVSAWARVVAVAMRIYAVGVFTYLTGAVASYYVGKVSPQTVLRRPGMPRAGADRSAPGEGQ